MKANHILRSTLGVLLLLGTLPPVSPANAQTAGETEETRQTAAAPNPLFATETEARSREAGQPDEGPERPSTLGFLPLPRLGPWVGYAKWGSLGAAAGLASLGFLFKEDANSKFDRLVRRCERSAELCRERNRDGSYADPELEGLFQDVRSRDEQAQISLIAAQVSFGVSLALFIVDWQQGGDPGNIPYDPDSDDGSRLQLTVLPGELAVRYYMK